MKTIVAVLLALASSVCFAQGLYVGGSLGMAMVEFDTASRSAFLTSEGLGHTGISTDEEDAGFKAYIGYRIHRNFAVEGGIVDLGEYSARATIVSLGGVPLATPGTITETISSKTGLHFAGLGILPINQQLDVFGKIGVYSVKVENNIVASGTGGTATIYTASDHGSDLLLGAGLRYNFTHNLSGRVEWEKFFDIGSEATGEGNLDLVSFGLVYSF